jgi:MFS family permease
LTAITLRRLAPSAFLPALTYEIGNGAIAPVIALTALREGATPAAAGFVVALLGVGQILGDLPAGFVAERLGDRRAMMLAGGVAACGSLACFVSRSLWVLGPAVALIGTANAMFYLGRVSYLTDVVPVDLRARAMSTLGGSHRIGLFIGPFVGVFAIRFAGLRAAYLVAIAAAAAAALCLWIVPDVATTRARLPRADGAVSSLQVLRQHRRLFATLGFAVLLVGAVRAARQTVVPLWANHLGLSPEQTSLIFGIAGVVDAALFYPAGIIMDRFGRLAIALPCMAIVGGSMIALPLTTGPVSLTVVAIVMSLGNGIGSGIIITLGADTAPRRGRTQYLAMWRLCGDAGNAAGPLITSAVAVATTLATGIVAIGLTGGLAVGALALWVPKHSPYATPAAMRAHRAPAERSRDPATPD